MDNGENFIIREMNRAGLANCRVSREEAIGKNLMDVFPNVDDFGFVDVLRRVWRTGKSEHSPTALYQDDRVYGWTEMYVYKLPSEKVVAIFETQTKLIEAKQNFKKKVEFETVISNISSQFVNPKSIDDAINFSLRKIGTLSKSSRSYLFIFNEDTKTMSNTHEWCAEGVPPQITELQNTPMEAFPWSINKIKKEEILNIDSIDNLPPEASSEKQEFLRENIKSLIFLPIKIGQRISGFIGFDDIKSSKKWSEDDVNLLKITSDIIGNALTRRDMEQELAEINIELKKQISERNKELKESEIKYQKWIKECIIGVWVIDSEYNTTLVNPHMSIILGYLEKEMIGKSLLSFMDVDSQKLALENLKRQKDKKVSLDIEFTFLHKNGNPIYTQFRATPIFDDDGKFEGAFAFIADISARKKAENILFESKQLLEMTLNSLQESIFILNAEVPPRIINCNPNSEKIFGYNREEFMNRTTAFLHIDIDSLKEFQNYLYPEIEKSGYIRNFEYKMKRKDGTIFPTEHSVIPLKNQRGDRIGWVSVVRDITERKIAEQRLKESEEKFRKSYYQTNLYKDIFAHDINNILQNISSSVELSSLYLNNPEKLHTIKELYDIVDEQVNRAKKLISNVRKITELQDSEIILEKMDSNRVLKHAIEFLQSSFQTRNINIQLNSPIKRNFVYANNLLLDVFENILINAVRHNNKSKIDITIDISKEQKGDKNYTKMEFKDNGVGISDHRKKTIFERGTQKLQKTKGMGLGLSLVKKIIDIYHGDIWVEDRVKGDHRQGSNFIVLIPTNS
ncbi:MAG: PAS domain S-box protein [Promethearchaeota archaeon]